MKSAKCVNCGFVGWSDAEFCKKCGAPMGAASFDMVEPPAGNFTPSYSNYGFAGQPELKKGLAVRALRTIHGAEATYLATKGKGDYGTLNDLQRDGLISTDLASGVKSGYRFKVEVFDAANERPAAFEVVAVPTEYGSSGTRSFFVDETGVLRGEDSHGLEANRNTPPINFNRD